MNHERFMVPEALFHPSDLGIDQAGVHEAVWAAIQAAPPRMCKPARGPPCVCSPSWAPLAAMQATLLQRVVLVGGNAHIPGMAARLYGPASCHDRAQRIWNA
jgi:actin-related protein 6